MNRIELGVFLRQQRKKLDKSLEEMAKLVGCSFPYLSDIEKGSIPAPGYDKLAAIAKYYNVDINLLLGVFYPTEEVKEADRQLDEAVKKIIEDSSFNAGTRTKAAVEKMGTYTKKLLLELYEKCDKKKSK